MSRSTSLTVPECLSHLPLGEDGIFSSRVGDGQEQERRMRERIAAEPWADHLGEVSRHHSIPVMDNEVDRFLSGIPYGGIIADIGGCWGWHWRRLVATRPDVRVVIIDFIRGNLVHAIRLLGEEIGHRIFLVQGDATLLDLPDASVDGYWTVQTLQHVEAFEAAIKEAHRVLRPGGDFALYSLHDAPLVRLAYRLCGHNWHVEGHIPGAFYLERMSARQRMAVEHVFGRKPERRFTEILFNPDLKVRLSGREGHAMGRVDARLSGDGFWQSLIARQQSLHLRK